MGSKKLFVLGALLPLSLIACLQFAPLPEPPAGLGGNAPGTDLTCLDRLGGQVEDLLSGSGSGAGRSDMIWSCAEKALHVFETRVRGEKRGEYTASELRRFMTQFFLKNVVVSDDLLNGVMQLKSSLLGGSPDKLAQQELLRTREWIDFFRRETAALEAMLPFFLNKRLLDDQTVQSVSSDAMLFGQRLAQRFSESQVEIRFSTLRLLLTEFSRIVDSAGLSEQLHFMANRVVLLEMIKEDWIGGTGDSIRPEEWAEILKRAAQAMRIYLKNLQIENAAIR